MNNVFDLKEETITYFQQNNNTEIIIKEEIRKIEEIEEIQKEKGILLKVSHPNLVTYYSIVHLQVGNKMKITSQIEYMNLLDLFTYIHNLTTSPPISFVRYSLIQLLNGLQQIRNSCHMILNSLTPYTILLSSDDRSMPLPKLKIANFVHQLNPNEQQFKYLFAAPEIINDIYNRKFKNNPNYYQTSDIWSLGMICYFIITGKHPFEERNIIQSLRKKEKINFNLISNKELRNLLEKMLEYDYNKRISFKQLLQHPFIRYSYSLIYPNQTNHNAKNGCN